MAGTGNTARAVNQTLSGMTYDQLVEALQNNDLFQMSYPSLLAQLQIDLQPLGIDGAPVDSSQPNIGDSLVWNGEAWAPSSTVQQWGPWSVLVTNAGAPTVIDIARSFISGKTCMLQAELGWPSGQTGTSQVELSLPKPAASTGGQQMLQLAYETGSGVLLGDAIIQSGGTTMLLYRATSGTNGTLTPILGPDLSGNILHISGTYETA